MDISRDYNGVTGRGKNLRVQPARLQSGHQPLSIRQDVGGVTGIRGNTTEAKHGHQVIEMGRRHN